MKLDCRNAKRNNRPSMRPGPAIRLGLAVAVFAALMLAVSPAWAAAQYKWKISQGIAEDHPAAKRCKQFAALVEEQSK